MAGAEVISNACSHSTPLDKLRTQPANRPRRTMPKPAPPTSARAGERRRPARRRSNPRNPRHDKACGYGFAVAPAPESTWVPYWIAGVARKSRSRVSTVASVISIMSRLNQFRIGFGYMGQEDRCQRGARRLAQDLIFLFNFTYLFLKSGILHVSLLPCSNT